MSISRFGGYSVFGIYPTTLFTDAFLLGYIIYYGTTHLQ